MVGLSVSLYQFPGTIFRCRENDFSPFSAACSGVCSCPISCVSVRSCSFASLSRLCVELIKTARVIIHPLSAKSHPSYSVISYISSPRLSHCSSTWMAGRFFLLAVLLSVSMRSSFPSIGLWRLIAFPSRCYCPRVGSPCLLAVLGPGYCACPVLVVMP